MKTIKKLSLLLLLLIFASSCINAQFGKRINGNGDVITENRNVPDYDKIAVGGSFDVKLVAGKEGKISIKGESNLLEYIVVEVKGDLLKIRWEQGISTSNHRKIIITVPFEDINAVSLAGSSDIIAEDNIQAKIFKTSLTGSGSIKLTLKAQEVISKISGSGNIDLEGRANQHACTITGSGDIGSFKLKTKGADVRITGSGSVKVDVSNHLKVRITGSGDVYYSGSPDKQDVKVTGSGSVHSR